jgi:hypothetical protein
VQAQLEMAAGRPVKNPLIRHDRRSSPPNNANSIPLGLTTAAARYLDKTASSDFGSNRNSQITWADHTQQPDLGEFLGFSESQTGYINDTQATFAIGATQEASYVSNMNEQAMTAQSVHAKNQGWYVGLAILVFVLLAGGAIGTVVAPSNLTKLGVPLGLTLWAALAWVLSHSERAHRDVA